MPKSYDVLFASSNTHKYEEAEKILAEFDIELGFFQTELVEIQDDSLSKIALQKVLNAYEKCKKPVIVEADGLSSIHYLVFQVHIHLIFSTQLEIMEF